MSQQQFMVDMPESAPEISVCLCTYKRPDMLSDCLNSLIKQTFSLPFEIIVTDNDCHRSGEEVVHEFNDAFHKKGIPVSYLVEPVQNIALARNRCVQAARGNLVAFIDDDECAVSHWLETLYQILIETKADGVWGPVIPEIPQSFPEWMRKSRLFDRPTQKNKSVMNPTCLRTGNAILKRGLLTLNAGPFDERLGRTGGSDYQLFTELQSQGFKFVWSEDATVVEQIEEKRRHLRWHLKRGYRGGLGHSHKAVEEYGWCLGLFVSTSRILPSLLRSSLHFIGNINNIRAAIYHFLTDLCGHAGKVGYFLKIKVEEYV